MKERHELRVTSSFRRTDVGRMYGEKVQVGSLFALGAAASIPMLLFAVSRTIAHSMSHSTY